MPHARYGVVAVIRREDRFLTITRSQTVIAPGKICFPGGGIESDETPRDALIRECLEEIGVLITPIKEFHVSVTPWNVHLRWWFATLPEPVEFRLNPHEIAAIQWLSAQEMLAHPDLLESNRAIVECLLK